VFARRKRSFRGALSVAAARCGSFAAAALVLGLATAPCAAAPEAWAVGSLERVRPDAPAGSAAQITLHAARGEYESFQIIVRGPVGGLTNVNVTAPNLAGPSGQQIAVGNVTLYREHYVYIGLPVRGGHNQSEGPGWYPDGLIPFVDPVTGQDLVGAPLDAVPFDLAEGRNQGIWVDVFVPRTAVAGDYTGTFVVTSDQGAASVDLHLTVWDFMLPVTAALKSSFGISPDYRAKGEQLLRNKIMPRHTEPDDQAYFMSQYGLNCTNSGFYGKSGWCSMVAAPSVAQFQAKAAENQPGLFLYDYSADEIDPCTNLYPLLKQWGRNMHQAGINQLVTMSPVPELYDDGSGTGRSAVDIWVVLPKMYDDAVTHVHEVLDKGDQVWSYNDLIQDDHSPKWEIDFSPINYRIQAGFISQTLGLTGLLYWKSDLWTADPWNDPNGYSSVYPGEGMLLYPGDQVGIDGVCPSMRLKYLRDGVEDYEYIQLLKEEGEGDAALAVAASVATSWSDWTRDPAVLEAARLQLGGMFHRTFIDVPPGFWSYDEIQAAYDSQIVTGYADGKYHPDWDITRGQMAVFVARSICTPTGEAGMAAYTPPATPTFPDVPTSYWCYKHVEYLDQQKVVTGYPDGLYRPTSWVTRDQMAVYIARAMVDPKGDEGLAGYVPPAEPTFSDIPVTQWARKYIEFLAEAGVVIGYPDGLYRPGFRVTRDQMAVYIAHAFRLM
jgi:hypothetical protein